MKVTDYIIHFLESKGVTDIFGYPGGSINHLIDSASKSRVLTAHLSYHEQGAAFAACGYAQASKKLGVAYSTSGPGATNLVTGIANAYFDSTPVLFITGQVDSYTARGDIPIRQRGFQETDVISMVHGLCKWVKAIEKPYEIIECLEKAYFLAFDGNPGPVVLDIPNDVQRAEIDVDILKEFSQSREEQCSPSCIDFLIQQIKHAACPVFLFGNGIKQAGLIKQAKELIEKSGTPALFSLPAADILPYDHPLNYGFIGGNGQRYANAILGKCDLLVVFGCRLSTRQIGAARKDFIPQAKLVRIDIDSDQLHYSVRNDEMAICTDLKKFLPALLEQAGKNDLAKPHWLEVCDVIRGKLQGVDDEAHTQLISALSDKLPQNIHITADVGQNLLWTMRSFHIKEGQRLFMSAGHGAMGYSLPAAIGVYYATQRTVYAFCGDGGFMMNLQELQFVKRERLPIKIVCLNNSSLGMIRSWQGRYLGRFSQTTEDSGYQAANFEKIAAAFDFKYTRILDEEDLDLIDTASPLPELIEIVLPHDTETKPNGSITRQLPEIEMEL